MRWRMVVAVMAMCAMSLAQGALTVEQLTSFVRSSIQLKHSDAQVAKFLAKAAMSEKLEAGTIEDLRSEGAGPKTVEALERLRAQSQQLQAAKKAEPVAKPVPAPPPSEAEQGKVLDEVREYALNYSKSLPDFICAQVVRRYAQPQGGGDSWRPLDTLTLKLSYFEQKEDYKLVMVNNQVATQSYQQVGGSTSTGEFGSMLREIFEPRTQTRFEWDHWATLRKRRAMVFRYRVSQLTSQWHLNYEKKLDVVPSYNGLIYVDKETRQILRITLVADDIPLSFPIKDARTTLDYDYVELSNHTFLLPLKAEMRLLSDGVVTRNDEEFRLYRKFSAESELKFDTPPPLSEEQTKEQTAPPKK